MYKLTNKILVGQDFNDKKKYFIVDNVYEFEVTNSTSEIPSTGTFTLTKKNVIIDGNSFKSGENVFNIYDKVRIYSTYEENDKKLEDIFLFEGYITSYANDNTFLKFTIESNSFLLKKAKRENFSIKNPKLSDILLEAFKSYSPVKNQNVVSLTGKFISDYEQKFDIVFNELSWKGTWHTSNEPKTPMEIFNLFREELKCSLYEFENKIYIAQDYPDSSIVHKFAYPYVDKHNFVIDNMIDNKTNDIQDYIIKAKSVLSPTQSIKLAYAWDNTKGKAGYVEYSTERDKPEFLNLTGTEESSVRILVENSWNKIINGNQQTGSFLCFGYPIVRLGDTIEFNWEGKLSKYLVSGVKRKSSNNGIRQEIRLGIKA